MNIVELYALFKQYPSVQTDTRKLQPGQLFFALKGPNFNANAFAETALINGAAYAIIDDEQYAMNAKTIVVRDVLETLQELALYHRKQFNIPFIAITGSNGKTTTKELIHATLSERYKTYTTHGNLNNHIGVPLTILAIKNDAEMAVIEMGANHVGEIADYCRYTLPTHGLITNVGKAHLEGFGGLEGVRKGKGELYDHLKAENGVAFVMWDYEYLQEMSAGISQVITYGTHDADIAGQALQSEPLLEIAISKGFSVPLIRTNLVGTYNVPNVMAAICLGKFFDVPDELIVEALENYQPSNSRSQLIKKNGNHIILDAYNANPSSMKAAIENFQKISAAEKVLILGAMAELGNESVAEHQHMVELIGRYDWKEVVLVGGDFLKLTTPYTVLQDSSGAADWFKARVFNNTYILIKGSRSAKMEKVLED